MIARTANYDPSKKDENSEFENLFLSDEEVELEDIQQIVDDILVTSPNTLQESRNEPNGIDCSNDEINDGNSDEDFVLPRQTDRDLVDPKKNDANINDFSDHEDTNEIALEECTDNEYLELGKILPELYKPCK